MKEGKFSQAVFDRSVFRVIKNENSSVAMKGHIGRNISILNVSGCDKIPVTARTFSLKTTDEIPYKFAETINAVSCGGSMADAVYVTVLFPVEKDESVLKEIIVSLEKQCEKHNMQIMGVDGRASSDVLLPVVTLSVIGTSTVIDFVPAAKTNQDIVITNYIGASGTSILSERFKDELALKLPEYLIVQAEKYREHMVVQECAMLAYESGASLVYDVAEGGIMAALWEMAYSSGVGIEADIRKTPIKQETVEICECLQVNPYELFSAGVCIIVTDNGAKMCEVLQNKGINAVVVGRTTDKNDRILINEEEVRHLTPAMPDSLYGKI